MKKKVSQFELVISKITSHFWWNLPLDKNQKEKIKTFVFTHFRFIFNNTAFYRNWKSGRFLFDIKTDNQEDNSINDFKFKLKKLYNCPPVHAEPINSFAVVIHVFYLEIFDEILSKIDSDVFCNLKFYVSSPETFSEVIQQRLNLLSINYEYYAIENRGRDILPFLKVMPKVIEDGFQIILKIHTKKSKQLKNGNTWRKDVYQKLLQKDAMTSILNMFNSNPEIGIVGPEGHIVPINLYYGSNSARLKATCQAFKTPIKQLSDMNFVAGSMFYARVQALIPLLNLGLQSDDFEPELGQLDGTMAHSIERAFAISAYTAGLKLVDTAYCQNVKKVFITKNHKFAR